MVPSVRDISVEVDCGCDTETSSNLQYQSMFTRLFSSIIQLAKTRLKIQRTTYFGDLDWDTIVNGCTKQLSNITLGGSISDKRGYETIRRNAKALPSGS